MTNVLLKKQLFINVHIIDIHCFKIRKNATELQIPARKIYIVLEVVLN